MLKPTITILIVAFFINGCVKMGRYESVGVTCQNQKVMYQNNKKAETIYLKEKKEWCGCNSIVEKLQNCNNTKLHAFRHNL